MEFQRLSAKLANYPVRRWFVTEIANLAKDIRGTLATTSAITSGGVAASGVTVSASVLQLSTTGAILSKVNGVLKASLAILTNVDVMTAAGSVGQPIFQDGSSAAAISLALNETAQVTLVAVDSTGAGAATGDNGALLYVAVVAGGPATYAAQTKALTDSEIRSALLASAGVHSGSQGFVRIANVLWDQAAGAPVATVTVARSA